MSRILAIDHGQVRLGLAACDADRRIASPLAVYTRRDETQDAAYLKKIVADEEIGLIVVGLPVHNDGHEGASARAAISFGTWLAKETGVRCVYFDERFTTVAAESALWEAGLTHKKRRARRDAVAAQMILQAFLEAGCPDAALPDPL